MSSRIVQHAVPLNAATDVPPHAPVKFFGASNGVRAVISIATTSDEAIGISGEVGAAGGQPIAIYDRGSTMKAVAGATITDGGDVGYVGATTVAGPSGNYSQPLLGPVSGASGSKVFRVGQAVMAAVPGQVFSFYVSPRQLSGLA